ncbi:MAG: Fe-S metabolism protein SufE [Ignavibacteria bacterium RBG_13_36_8]|nr:MAG: Fe-S metabolism protein SufE [Ignavibacteria bacterium RBG_13_36_8]
MTIQEKQQVLIEEFDDLRDWEERYAHIIVLGKNLNPLRDEYRTEKNKIEGCQSQVWMNARLDDGKIYLDADSDAMIVKGLIAMLMRVYSGHTPDEILASSPEFIKKIGIENHLSPTRKNGLSSMLKQIQMYAVAFKALASK